MSGTHSFFPIRAVTITNPEDRLNTFQKMNTRLIIILFFMCSVFAACNVFRDSNTIWEFKTGYPSTGELKLNLILKRQSHC